MDYKDVGTHNLWPLRYWQALMEEVQFHEDESFTRAEGNLCFYYSKFEVVDYQKDANDYECLDWLSFLEAIGHIVRYKEIPRKDQLQRSAEVESVVELVKKLEDEGTSWNEFMARVEQEDEGDDEEEPFHVRLDEVIQLLFHMLARNAAKLKADAKKAAEAEQDQ